MANNFFAYLSRMKQINRWSLMRNIRTENIQEHSHMAAVLAHALCEIENSFFGGHTDPAHSAELALYHDVGEVIIGDLPTPVKYFNPEIKASYGHVEDIARQKLLSMLPPELEQAYRPLIMAEEESREARYVKAADKLCAYIKCVEELTAGNREFEKAEKAIKRELDSWDDLPALKWFMENCMDGFSKTLDELN